MSIFFSVQTFTNLSTKECCIDTVGEDNKSIIHTNFTAHVVRFFPEQDTHVTARAEQHLHQ